MFGRTSGSRPYSWRAVSTTTAAIGASGSVRAARTVRELTQVRTADFFLTLEQQGDGQGQLPERLPVRLDRAQTRYQVTFIVGDATRPDPAICNIRGERVMPPELQRLRRLDVVVVVQLQRPRAATFDPAIQDGRTTLQVDALRFGAGGAGHALDHAEGLLQTQALSRNARRAAQLAQALDKHVGVLIDVGENRLELRSLDPERGGEGWLHGRPMLSGRRGTQAVHAPGGAVEQPGFFVRGVVGGQALERVPQDGVAAGDLV